MIRNNVYTLFEQFDFPDPTMPTGSRQTTTVAPQALLLMNSDFALDSAAEFARLVRNSVDTDAGRLDVAWQRALGRSPTSSEISQSLAFLEDIRSRSLTRSDSVDAAAEERAWSLLCQNLLACNEFLFVR